MFNYSYKIANYKCFDNIPQGFEKIYYINLIIGKNNSGKSSLIDLIEYSCVPNQNINNGSRYRQPVVVKVKATISDTFIDSAITKNVNWSGNPSLYKEQLTNLIGEIVEYELTYGTYSNIDQHKIDRQIHAQLSRKNPLFQALVKFMEFPLFGKHVKKSTQKEM